MKILLGVSPVGGHLAGIQSGLNRLGIESDLIYYRNNRYDMPADMVLMKDKISGFERIKLQYDFFKKATAKYDIIHFVFGRSFLSLPKNISFLDLPFIPDRVKVFVTFNGCDIRPKDFVAQQDHKSACAEAMCGKKGCGGIHDYIKRKKVESFRKRAKESYVTTPDLLSYVPGGKFLMQPKHTYFDFDYVGISGKKKKLNVVHAPSNELIKGTRFVIDAVERFPGQINFQLVENCSNEEAMKIYSEADLVIDQLRVGWYGGLAVEAMRMGKPVVAYLSPYALDNVSDELKQRIPVINADKENLVEVLDRLLKQRSLLKERSLQSYEYVNDYHNPVKIAEQVYNDYCKS